MSYCPDCDTAIPDARDTCECGYDPSGDASSYDERVEKLKAYSFPERARIVLGFRNPDDAAMVSLSPLHRVTYLAFGTACFWFTATMLFPPTGDLELLFAALLAPVLGVCSLLISVTGRRIDYEKYMPG